jgi:hypothetical protein
MAVEDYLHAAALAHMRELMSTRPPHPALLPRPERGGEPQGIRRTWVLGGPLARQPATEAPAAPAPEAPAPAAPSRRRGNRRKPTPEAPAP